MVPDTRDDAAIRASVHAVAQLGDYSRVVRGVDRFTHLPDRTPAAVVWVADKHGMGGHHCEFVALSSITIHPGRTA